MSGTSMFAGIDAESILNAQEEAGAPRIVRVVSSRTKRSLDILVATVALLLLGPLLLMLGVALWLTQGAPLFVKHRRVGREGKSFQCLKLRTMVKDADAVLLRHLATSPQARLEWEATRKLRSDPRVTAVGQVLRKTSIDELPQLINVIRGEMSLVGPRPIVLDEINYYGTAIDEYYRVRPGLTGLWQVSGRSNTSYPQRVAMDVKYVNNWSLVKDLRIMIMTIPALVSARGSY